MPARRLIAAFAVLALTACGGEGMADRVAPSVEVTDSAGVRIVTSNPTVWPLPTLWTIGEAPTLRIGELDGEEAYNLDGVVGATLDSEGRIVVLERAARLRWYDGSGEHLRTRSFMGEGPGEVRGAVRMLPYLGDSLLVLSPGGGGPAIPGSVAYPGGELPERMGWGGFVVFDANGEYGRQGIVWSEGFPGPFDGSFVIYGNVDMGAAVLGDGSMVHQTSPSARLEGNVGERLDVRFPLTRSNALGAQIPDTITLARYSQIDVPVGGSELNSNQRLAYQTVLFDPGYVRPVTMGRRIFLADAATGWISVFEAEGAASRLVEEWRPAVPRVVPTDALVDEYIDAVVAGRSSEDAADSRDRFSQLGRAESIPVVSEIRMDGAGHLWMAEGTHVSNIVTGRRDRGVPIELDVESTRWTVFSPSGEPLGTVETPANLRVDEIGEAYILGTSWDDLGVPRIELYDLIEPAG